MNAHNSLKLCSYPGLQGHMGSILYPGCSRLRPYAPRRFNYFTRGWQVISLRHDSGVLQIYWCVDQPQRFTASAYRRAAF